MPETRAQKAQRLVDEGRVRMTKHGHFFDDAQVDCGHHTYLVTLYSNAPYACACGWGIFRTPTTDLCAHALAVLMTMKKEEGAMTKPSLGKSVLVLIGILAIYALLLWMEGAPNSELRFVLLALLLALIAGLIARRLRRTGP